MTDITIKRVEGSPDELLRIYSGQSEPQGCFIWLDLRDGTMGADYNAEIGNAVPFDVWHGIVRRYEIPVMQPATINALMEQIAPLAAIIVEHSEIVWDGSNHVARLDAEADAAEEKIDSEYESGILDNLESDVFVRDASDWLEPIRHEVRERLANGETVEALVEEYGGDGSSEDRPVVNGLTEYLEELRGMGASE